MISMKNVLAVIIFSIILFPINSYSQLKNLGIKGGINISNASIVTSYTGDPIDYPSENNIGFNAIIFYNFLNLNNFGLSAELGYSSRGFNEEVIEYEQSGNETGRFIISNNLNYIDLSLISKFIIHNYSVSPYASLGPILAFYLGYSSDATNDRNQNYVFGENNKDLNSLDNIAVGLKFGAGVEINNLIPQTLLAEVRYYTDLEGNYSISNFKKIL